MNFNDPRSKLFFEFVRIKNELQPKYFLLENVVMKKEYENIITDNMKVEPILINSSLVSAQNRKRLYWTNIKFNLPIDLNICFNKYLYRLGHGYIKDEIKYFKKYPSLAAQSPASKYRIIDDLNKIEGIIFKDLRTSKFTRSATPEECELFQTLPKNYTSCVNKTNRYKLIGNGWTVDIIAQIFKSLS